MTPRYQNHGHDKHRLRRTLIVLAVIILGPIIFICLGELSAFLTFGHL